MNRFFVDESNITDNEICITNKEDIKHIVKVLRLKNNALIEISDGIKYEYIARIKHISNESVISEILEQNVFAREPNTKITLYQGIPKQNKMEYIIQKCVELGIFEIVPIFTDRTIVQDKGNFHKKIERWQRIAYSSSEQSKRGIIPCVNKPLSFTEMLEDIQNKDLTLFLNETEQQTKIKEIIKGSKFESVAIIVGPEGGFSEQEISEAIKSGTKSVSLGKTILRTETAGTVALAIVLYELEG